MRLEGTRRHHRGRHRHRRGDRHALAAEGARITLIGRRREPLEIAATGTGFFATADVTDRAQVDRAFAEAREMQGPVTILVNNAGAAESAPFAKLSHDSWRRMMGVNLDGVFHCCQAALPDLLAAEQGRIVTSASTAGLIGYRYTAAYSAAKHGAVGLMRALPPTGLDQRHRQRGLPRLHRHRSRRPAVATISGKTGRSAEQARRLAGLTRRAGWSPRRGGERGAVALPSRKRSMTARRSSSPAEK